jgi:NADPH:quinone reductase-like Zn-dependent oxidoreductase
MRVVRLYPEGVLSVEEVERPRPGAGDVLVRVHAAALTRDELEWPADRLPAVPSYEVSGVVTELGPGVAEVVVGDEVYALLDFGRGGGAAEYALVAAATLAPSPRTVGHLEAAALPLAGLSAWQALFTHAALAPGERLLVTGSNGGVGHLAVQLARHHGAEVVAEGEPGPVDVVFDTAGGERLARAAGALRAGGRLVSVAEEPRVDRNGVQATYFVVEPDRGQLVELARLVDSGELHVAIDSAFPLDDAPRAFERVAARGKNGKVVLQVDDE